MFHVMLSLLFETTRWSHIPPFLTILQMEGVTTGSDAESLWAAIRGGSSQVQAHTGTLIHLLEHWLQAWAPHRRVLHNLG